MMVDMVIHKGLEGVVIATNPITFIDGQLGKLMYRGYLIGDLAAKSTYEEVVWLLLYGELPSSRELTTFQAELAANRSIPERLFTLLRLIPPEANAMAALRTALSALAFDDTEAEDNSEQANRRKAVRLIAKVATVIAAFDRIRGGRDPIPPRDWGSHAANFLYMLDGKTPNDYTAHVFDVCLILHADHEMNASTFAARVTASTLSDIYSAIPTAVGTLKGPLHGGANTKVMEMLKEIGTPQRSELWIKDALARRERIMGFGHRVYKTEDPRATVLRQLSCELGERLGNTGWYEISRVVEKAVREQKGLFPNVDFYSASTYYLMGIKTDLYTPIFALSRIVGWAANLLEQYADNRLIRPETEYVGPKERPYIPLDRR